MIAIVALAAALVTALAGCSVQTAGAPKGDLTLVATFDDAQNLVAGHGVQIADVKVGSITQVRLRGYRAEVTMSIKDGIRVPAGTSAEIKVTSLLGENYVQLTPPPGRGLSTGPFLRSGARITRTSVQPSFEQVVGKAGPLIKSLAGGDVATIVNAGATAFGGNGPRLNAAVARTSDLLVLFAGQRRQLTASIDQLARLGGSLARGDGELHRTPVELERTTRVLDENKDKILHTVDRLTRAAGLLNDKVLAGRVQRLKTMINQLDPVLRRLGGDRARLTRLINGLVMFEEKLPRASFDGQLLLYPILRFVLPDGTAFPPGGGQAGTGVPKDLRNVLPDLDKIVGGGR